MMWRDFTKRRILLASIILAFLTLAAYWPVLDCGFIKYDDYDYVTENQHVLNGFSLEGIKWAFLIDDNTANWHPLTWLSHMLDCELFGQRAGLHHLTNLLIHTANVMLLLWILASMTGRLGPSAFVAAAFAVHPLHVESVAWIAERKDVLSGFFWVLTMACYLQYTRTRSRGSYLLTLFFLGLGLMAKPMLVTLPFVLLLLDFWPLNRLDRGSARSRIAEKIPFFILSAASCIVTFIAQREGGAVRDTQTLPFDARLSNAVVSYIAYIVKTVWPVRLAVLYPLRQIPPWQSIPALIALITVTAIALLLLRRKRYVAVGWFWYVGTLVPVIGLVQVGIQAMADRYTYIPSIGVFILFSWAAGELLARSRHYRIILRTAAVLLIVAMSIGTRAQLRYWRNNFTLYKRALAVTENNFIMHYNLGNALLGADQFDEAIVQYRRALQINPDYANAYNNLGNALLGADQFDEAIIQYRRALQIDPDNAKIHSNMGNAFAGVGRFDEAIVQNRRALQIDPDDVKVHYNLGNALLGAGQFDEAIVQYRRALQINPDYASAYNNLGKAFILAGQFDEAIIQYRRALQIDPDDVKVRNNLGLILQRQGRLDEAIDCFRMALRIDPSQIEVGYGLGFALQEQGQLEEAIHAYRKVLQRQPNFVDALNNLAWILAASSDSRLRNPSEAVALADRACELTNYNNPNFMDTLAVAYAAACQFDRAMETAQAALALAKKSNLTNLARKIRQRLQLYQTGQAYYESPSIRETPGQGKDSSTAPADNKK